MLKNDPKKISLKPNPAPAKSLPKSKNINSTISNITPYRTKPSIVSRKASPFEIKAQQPKSNKMITQESNITNLKIPEKVGPIQVTTKLSPKFKAFHQLYTNKNWKVALVHRIYSRKLFHFDNQIPKRYYKSLGKYNKYCHYDLGGKFCLPSNQSKKFLNSVFSFFIDYTN